LLRKRQLDSASFVVPHSVARARGPLIQFLFTFHRLVLSTTETHVPIPKYALDILVCPVCKTPVRLLADGLSLKCGTCRRVYPIRDDIPVMMPEEAKIAQD
jgi:uncharacterized protein YbaR (Trm112 family)